MATSRINPHPVRLARQMQRATSELRERLEEDRDEGVHIFGGFFGSLDGLAEVGVGEADADAG